MLANTGGYNLNIKTSNENLSWYTHSSNYEIYTAL